jgi:uncharacterized membrane protein YgcG
MKHVIAITLLFAATTAFAQTPSAATSERDRWAPWIGCWQVAEESVEDVAKLLATLSASPSTSAASGARVCVAPAADGGATMTTLVSGKTVLTETVVADGKSRPLSDPNCRGSQQAEWSQLGPRIYAKTEVSCGDQPTRSISGFSAVVSGPMWVDIQMVESEGRKSMRVRRYRRAVDQTTGAQSNVQTLGTMPLGGKLSMAEIKEASTKLAPEALQAVVLELGAGGYDLNARRLIELDEAGVPDSVIDLMVALSFPKKFIVERAVASSGPGGYGSMYGDELWGPFSMWNPLSMWGYYAHPRYYSSYYSPFGYYNWGYYDPYYYGYPGVVILNPGSGAGPDTPQGTGNGRVVDGQGYTRIRPNVPDAPSRAGNGGWGGTSSGSSAGSNSGSSSGGVSTGGYSGGGGGGERVAVPRPPGGN